MTRSEPPRNAGGREIPRSPARPCDLCTGPFVGCQADADGAFWCRRTRGFVPGYVVVGTDGTRTGYRPRRPDEVPDPEALRRIEEWLSRHAAERAALRDRAARCAELVQIGLSAIPAPRLADLIDAAVASCDTVRDIRHDLDDMADAVVGRAA